MAQQLLAYGNVGMMFPVSIAIGFFAGRLADRWLGTSPWLSLVGFTLGVVAAVRHLIRATGSESDSDGPGGPIDGA